MKNINTVSFLILFFSFSALHPMFFRSFFKHVPKNLGEVAEFMVTDFGRVSFYEQKGLEALHLKEHPVLYFMRKVGILPSVDKRKTCGNYAKKIVSSYISKIG